MEFTPTITEVSAQVKEGYGAHDHWHSPEDLNPYDATTQATKHRDWLNGWNIAKNEFPAPVKPQYY